MAMNIRNRTVAGGALVVSLLILSALHVLWAAGNPFPAGTFAELTSWVIPQSEFPSAGLTALVAIALGGGAVVAFLRVLDLNRGRQQRSRLLRVAVYGIAAVFGLRALEGVVSGVIFLAGGGDPEGQFAAYHRGDLVAYTPLCIALALAALALAGRPRVPADLFRHALSILRREPFVHLVTLDPTGSPRSRVLYRLGVDTDGTVWLSTDGASEKADDIRADPRVVLSVYDTKAQAAVSIEGDAAIVTNPALLSEKWYPPLRLYFSRGVSDERYVLIRVTPRRFGLVDFSRDVTPEPFGLRRVSAEVPDSLERVSR